MELLNLSNPIFIINQLISEGEFCKANHANNCKDYLSLSLQQAMKDLVTRLGEDEHQWQWGKIHMSTFKELGLGEVKWLSWIWNRRAVTPGGAYTINVGAYDNNFDQFAGATYRQIIDLSSFENSHYVQALGQSDNPLNSHYDDQLDLWKRNLYIKMKH
jgi:penicillin amidase